MVIHTFEHEYPVSYVKEISDTSESYICRNSAMGGLCRILAINDKHLFASLLPDLSDAAANSSFSDFIEHFMYDGALCIVMTYTQGITLRDKLETESFTLAEKLELARRILERMILQEIPDYYLARCCSENNIIVESDMTLHFNYSIEDMETLPTCTHVDAMKKVAELLRFLFAKEEEEYASEELKNFLAGLPELTEKCDLIALYSAYHEMMLSAVAAIEQPDGETSVWHRLWEKVKKLAAVLRKILMLLLLVAAVAYLIWSIGDTKGSGTPRNNFDRIGTVEIM